ncbi:hypothetical protein [Actinoplanes sp. L3-i22]|uniref:hypothetical protein n=1 Tax=Actinoplanes sp. L3-i22 TaxID=2836373 RepID=UPI001C78044F|nr:hypothetical protein [Actinoplanes sp. L3-i22]BCY13193.1 hypothetical protein L3i22_082810 [Actinoplanes sp. L3-i22]
MTETGWRLAADLSELRMVGQVDLPALSYTYSALNNMIDDTAGADAAAFSWSAGGWSQAYEPWAELRNSFQELLGKTSENMDIAGGAVLRIVDHYAAADDEAAAALRSAWQNGPPATLNGEYIVPGEHPEVRYRT